MEVIRLRCDPTTITAATAILFFSLTRFGTRFLPFGMRYCEFLLFIIFFTFAARIVAPCRLRAQTISQLISGCGRLRSHFSFSALLLVTNIPVLAPIF